MPHLFFLTSFSKPLVCLFPALFKQNLLSFIYLVHSVLPRYTVLRLLSCLSQDPHPSPWVTALVRQLERNLGTRNEEPLYTPLCSQRLKELSQRLAGSGETGGWDKCFSGQTVESGSQSASGLSELGTQRKRKGSFVTLDSDGEETGQKSKRIKTDVCGSECQDAEEQSAKEEKSGKLGSDASAETPADEQQPAPDSPCDALPEHIKVETGFISLEILLITSFQSDQIKCTNHAIIFTFNTQVTVEKWVYFVLCLFRSLFFK